MVRVADYMTRNPYMVYMEDTLDTVYALMRDHDVRHLPVVDINGHLIGVITRNDLYKPIMMRRGESLGDKQPVLHDIWVQDVMSSPAISVHAGASLKSAAVLLLKNKIGGLPVLDDEDRLVGIITVVDVLKAAIDVFSE